MSTAAMRIARTADADDTLSPLPSSLARGLIAVTTVGCLSLVSSAALVMYMIYRFFLRRRKDPTGVLMNQFVALIFNLVLADLHQAIGFTITAKWLWDNAMVSGSPICWAQGWFLNSGDVGSGAFTLAIALHAFADIVFNRRPRRATFLVCILCLWLFVYFCSSIGIMLHSADFYKRAGPWCWISEKYMLERLWLHYFWILLVEFTSIVIYAVTFIALRRMKTNGKCTPEHQIRAASTAKIVIAYPIIYVFCTLPAVIVRLHIIAGASVTYTQLCVIGVFICSNGWLDVLLYTLTRWTLIFGQMGTKNVRALDTYTTWADFRADHHFGNTTRIESTPQKVSQVAQLQRKLPHWSQQTQGTRDSVRRGLSIVKTETVVDVHRELCSPLERIMIERMNSEAHLSRTQSPIQPDPGPDLDEMPNLEFLSEKKETCTITEVPE